MSPDYQPIFESLSGLYMVMTSDLKIVAASDGYFEATMRKRSDIANHPNLFEFFPDNPHDPAGPSYGVHKLKESLEEVVRTKQKVRMDSIRYDIQQPDGGWETRYWAPTNIPVLGPDKEVKYIVHSVEDITRFVELDNNIRAFVSGIKDYAIFMMDSAGYVQTWNDGAEKIIGYAHNEIIGKHFSAFYEPVEYINSRRNLNEAEKYGRFEEEGWRIRKDGTRFWAHVVITAIYDESRRVRGFSKVVRDTTVDRQASLDLKAQANRFLNILQHAHSAVVSINEDGVISFWNQSATKIFGWTAEEMIGTVLDDRIIPPEYIAAHRAGMAKCKITKTGPVFNNRLTLTATRKDGTVFPVDLVVTKGNELDGTYIFTAFIMDITDRVEKHRVAVQNESLKRANEELELFAYVTSHDLQDPLRTMNAYLKLLSRKFPNPEAEGYLRVILQSNAKMSTLVSSLLQYARESGQTLNIHLVNLADVVNQVVFGLDVLIQENQAELRIGDMPTLTCDPVQIGQVFQNLIENAVKYRHPNRTPIVTVSHEENGREHLFTVSDNGIGIKNEDLDRLFVLFRRIRKDDKGVGFGLAVCKKIVEHHEGRIWAESVVGEGSHFHFAIPKNLKSNDAD